MSRLNLTSWQRQRLRRQLAETRDARVYRRTLAVLEFDAGRPRNGEWSTFVEWETGNISSSHRSLNRLLLALMRDIAHQGVLVLSDATLYPFLTDRIGNWRELAIYRDVYAREDVPGRLVVIVVGFDAMDPTVPLIRKGTDGRALR